MCICTEHRDIYTVQCDTEAGKSMQRYFSQPLSLKAAIFIGDERKTQSQMNEQR